MTTSLILNSYMGLPSSSFSSTVLPSLSLPLAGFSWLSFSSPSRSPRVLLVFRKVVEALPMPRVSPTSVLITRSEPSRTLNRSLRPPSSAVFSTFTLPLKALSMESLRTLV